MPQEPTRMSAQAIRELGHDPDAVSFFVPGAPRPQGNHRTSRSGYIYDTTKGLSAWRKAVADYARLEVRDTGRVFHAPCGLGLAFVIREPRTSGTYPYPTRQRDADLSKLTRAVEDSLVHGGLLLDDKLIVDGRQTMRWGETPGVHITLEEVA